MGNESPPHLRTNSHLILLIKMLKYILRSRMGQLNSLQVEQQPQETADYYQQQQQQDANGGWAVDNGGWGNDEPAEEAEPAEVEPQADGGNWAAGGWGEPAQEEQQQPEPEVQDDGGGGWASFSQQNSVVEAAPDATEQAVVSADGGRTAAAICLYDFESQGCTLMEIAFKFNLKNSNYSVCKKITQSHL